MPGTAHWLDGAAEVLKSSSQNLRELARISGLSPHDLYRHADLSNCDLRGQDLRGLDLTGAILHGAILDGRTKFDIEFDPRIQSSDYLFFRINKKLRNLINSDAYIIGYTYAVWYLKYLFEYAFIVNNTRNGGEVLETMMELDLSNFYSSTDDNDSVMRKIKIKKHYRELAAQWPTEIPLEERGSFILLFAMLTRYRYSHGGGNILKALDVLSEQEQTSSREYQAISCF